jgi:RNase P subunit RPR2
MEIVHVNKDRYSHLDKFSEEKKKIICNLAKVFVNSVINSVDENRLRLPQDIKRGSE